MFLPKFPKYPAYLCLFAGLFIIFYLLTLPGCKESIPPIDATFWAGDSKNIGITRAQDSKTIQCNQAEFDQYVCLSYDDVKKIYDTLLQCKEWPKKMTSKQAEQLYKTNGEIIHHVNAETAISQSINP